MNKTTNKHLKKNSVPVLKIFLIISILILLANGVHFALTYEKFFNYISIIGSSLFIIYMLFFYKKKKKVDKLCQSDNKENNDFLDDNEICLESRKIEPLINIINSHSSLSFFSMALIGKWGSGKSSYLRTLENELNNILLMKLRKFRWSQSTKHLTFKDFNYHWIEFCKKSNEYEIIKINVWKLENSKNITNEIRKEFDNIIFESNRVLWLLQLIKRLFIRDYFAILSKYATKYEIKASFSFEPTISASQNDFNNLLKEILGNKKVLLLIDELDRLESKDEIINIFKVIRYTASFDNVFVITALDIQQIENKLDDIEYIHKIFNLKYLVPSIDKDELIEYINDKIIPKFKKFSINKRELNILSSYFRNKIIDVISNYRELKNVFNDTYSFVKYLEKDSKDWNEYISFEFIFYLNLIKAVNFKIYTQLIFDKQLSKLNDKSDDEKKYNNDDRLKRLTEEIEKFKLGRILIFVYNKNNFAQYFDIYQQYKIYNYHISQAKYNRYIENINTLEEDFNEINYEPKDREKFLLNILDKNQKDKKNHSLILSRIKKLIPKITISIIYGNESKILEKLAIESFITEETKNIFIELLKQEKNIALVFMNYLFIELSKNTNNINNSIKSLICEYFKNLEIEDSEFNQHIQNLFSSVKKNHIKIYKIIYECFKGNRKIKKALLSNIHIKNIENFMKEIETSLDDFIDDNDEYTIWKGNDYESQLFNGKDLKGEIYKLEKDIKGNE